MAASIFEVMVLVSRESGLVSLLEGFSEVVDGMRGMMAGGELDGLSIANGLVMRRQVLLRVRLDAPAESDDYIWIV